LVGPHLLLRILSFAPKAVVLAAAAVDRCRAAAWVLGCGYLEMLVLTLPMALGLLPVPNSLKMRLRGLGLEVLMDGIQRNAFDQVRTLRRLPQHTLHCVLLYVLLAHQLHISHALARILLIWLAGFATCVVVEVPRRVDFAVLHCSVPFEAGAAPVVAVPPERRRVGSGSGGGEDRCRP
ncbi:hypothetical protein VOLCADRAFT_118053, partial [Volvox carteri f. nagariensis]